MAAVGAARGAGGANPARGAALGWALRTSGRRATHQWRALLLVTAVALLATTSVSTLTLLVVGSEQRAVRTALGTAAPADREVSVGVGRPEVGLGELAERTDDAVAATLGVPLGPGATDATSGILTLPREEELAAVGWVSVHDGVEAHAELVAGAWAGDTGDAVDAVDGAVPVAVPEAGARVLGLEVGDTLLAGVRSADEPLELTVVGIFRATDPDSSWWGRDRLRGAGHTPGYPMSAGGAALYTDGVGPLLTSAAALDVSPVELTRVERTWSADLTDVDVRGLRELDARLVTADAELSDALDDVTDDLDWSTGLDGLSRSVAGALAVTRAGVAVISALLLAVAVAALVQSARLLAETRQSEHDLTRARGASRSQLLAVALVESLALGGAAAVGGALLAVPLCGWLLRGTVLAGPGGGVGAAPAVAAGAVALLVAGVVVLPLVGPVDTFVEGENRRARPERVGGLLRTGGDLVLVALAAVAFFQLRAYRSPLAGRGAGAPDPVLVVSPTVLLVAGVLLLLRLLPVLARATERLAAGGRSLVGPLAAWEIGRRTARAGTAVLLVALTVAVATFAQSFAATWTTSQRDQTAFAVGAPVVVRPDRPTSAVPVALERAASEVPGTPIPEPVLRARGRVAVWTGDVDPLPTVGRSVDLLASTAAGRAVLDRGRVSVEGGAAVAALPDGAAEAPGDGIALPEDAVGLSVRITEQPRDGLDPLLGAAVIARVLLEDDAGVLSTLDLPSRRFDDDRPAQVLLPGVRAPSDPTSPEAWVPGERRTPLRVVGITFELVAVDSELVLTSENDLFDVALTVEELAAVVPAAGGPSDGEAAAAGEPGTEGGVAADGEPLPWPGARLAAVTVPIGALEPYRAPGESGSVGDLERPGTGLRLVGARTALAWRAQTGAVTAWEPPSEVPAVLSGPLADRLGVAEGDSVRLEVDDVGVQVVVDDVVPRVPTTSGAEHLAVDHTTLTRALAARGGELPAVDEWWVDVPPEDLDAFLGAAPTASGQDLSASTTTLVGATDDALAGALRVALPVGLWLTVAVAGLVTALGFGVHTAMTLRARDVELAQLRAVGMQQAQLVGVIATESVLLVGLGTAAGLAVGTALAWSTAKLLVVSPTGGAPVPAAVVHQPWADLALLLAGLVAALAVIVVAVARDQRAADPASLLRAAANR